MYEGEIDQVLVTEQQISDRIAELAERISADYADRELLLVGVLKGAVMVMSDLARALSRPVTLEFMRCPRTAHLPLRPGSCAFSRISTGTYRASTSSWWKTSWTPG